MKLLSGSELVSFIKVRQLKQARNLRQQFKIVPKLAIVRVDDNPVIDTYVRLKKNYATDIEVEVEEFKESAGTVFETIEKINHDPSFHGLILQLPTTIPDQEETLINHISPQKDVDGLTENSAFDPATPKAILWLLSGYNIELTDKKIAIVGAGRLVGKPLLRMLKNSGLKPDSFEKNDGKNLQTELPKYGIIITATGQAGLIQPEMISQNAVIVDAGTSSEQGIIKGDAADNVRQIDTITITPKIGGVGPLTVAALFDNLLLAAQNSTRN